MNVITSYYDIDQCLIKVVKFHWKLKHSANKLETKFEALQGSRDKQLRGKDNCKYGHSANVFIGLASNTHIQSCNI